MFKKTEDSEWSRFSRALSGQSKAGTEEESNRELPLEPASPSREATQVADAPVPSPAVAKPSAAQPYSRSHAPASQAEAEEAETVIGPHSSFEGNLKCESNLRIKGSARGEISCARSVIIEESAEVGANVAAANALVAGKLDGSIVCEGRLEILATGQVTGELTAGVLIIQEGAFFEGHLKMKDRKQDAASLVESAAARRFPSDADPTVN